MLDLWHLLSGTAGLLWLIALGSWSCATIVPEQTQ